MKLTLLISILFLSVLLSAQSRFDVASGTEFFAAQEQASAGDTIVWKPGTYTDTRMDLNKDGLIVTAEPYGTALFTGASRVIINADDVTFSGFQYVGGAIGTLHVMSVFGSNVLITHVNIQNYTSFKYLIMDEVCRNNTISYCNFENRLNKEDQNILSVLVDDEPGFHKIQYCSFKNFDGSGRDEGVEPIRIGVSSQGHLDSRTLVEYCYFTRCNGDGEIISHKSRQNVYRYNTFEDNPVAELVLRHGDEGIVYGNFFLNNMGGVRVREGSNHFIYNNYFGDLDRRSIFLQNDPSDPLSEVHIYHNTIVNSEELLLGGSGNNPPTNVVIANNIFSNPIDQLFVDETGSETWINNYYLGDLGIDRPSTGLAEIDPELLENPEGYFQPQDNSPVIEGANTGYPAVPLYPGMDYDNEILLDLMKEPRPVIASRAIGASEFSTTVNVQPHVTEMNTGPSYLFDNLVEYLSVNARQLNINEEGDVRSFDVTSNIDWIIESSEDWISVDISSGTGDADIIITIDPNDEPITRSGTLMISGGEELVTIGIFQNPASIVSVVENIESEVLLFPNPTDGRITLSNLPSGIESSLIELLAVDGRSVFSQEFLIDNNGLEIDFSEVVSGTYLMNVKYMNQSGTVVSESTHKLVRK